MQQAISQLFAAVYGADNFGECTYSATKACSLATENTQTLANTGTPIILCVGVAVGLIILGALLLVRLRRKKHRL